MKVLAHHHRTVGECTTVDMGGRNRQREYSPLAECRAHCHTPFLLQLRREKIDLENTLEQEQEALVNRLWKRMDKLEAEKR